MAEPLKNVYSEDFFKQFHETLVQVHPHVSYADFSSQILTSSWESYELKQRMSHIARVLREVLAPEYPIAIQEILRIIGHQRERDVNNGFNFEFMFFPDFVQQFGLEDYETSVAAIEEITKYASCEFVVRHFIVKYPQRMIQQMQMWAKHEHSYVRRLASEGMRTRLPWAIAVPELKQNPSHILPILEELISDESEWVRRSVSNSLNDLSKDYPEICLEFTKKWVNTSEEVTKSLKHGARGLLKQGHPTMLGYFGLNTCAKINLQHFSLGLKELQTGDLLPMKIVLQNRESQAVSLRLEYRVYFLRSNGTLYPKTFKITEKRLAVGEVFEVTKNHNFKEITTRKFYSGEHRISLLVNGNECEAQGFVLDAIHGS